jgi:HlyD family secretion protein
VVSGEATIRQCEAALRQARTYLDYTVVKSPIDGVILDRRVSIGQIVCASFNVPGLFLVAKDMRRMHVWASVGETDIGRVHLGSAVRFTVDAYPGETFEGKVTQIRLNPTKTGNPATNTFTVVVAADNTRGVLPYLTAKLQFWAERCVDAPSVPNDALQRASDISKSQPKVLASR